jgi:hypothetical protein
MAEKHREQVGDATAENFDFESAFAADYIPTYIHLRGARFFSPSGQSVPGNEGFFWRGRLDAVDGWSIGVLGP